MPGSAESCSHPQTARPLLDENAKRCTEMIRKIDRKARIVIWSVMFSPNHNAVQKYYLVNGPLTGIVERLPKDVVIANWKRGRRPKLKFFASAAIPRS